MEVSRRSRRWRRRSSSEPVERSTAATRWRRERSALRRSTSPRASSRAGWLRRAGRCGRPPRDRGRTGAGRTRRQDRAGRRWQPRSRKVSGPRSGWRPGRRCERRAPRRPPPRPHARSRGHPAVRTARQVPELGCCGWTGGRSGGPVLTGLVTDAGVTSAAPVGASCVRETVGGTAGPDGEWFEGSSVMTTGLSLHSPHGVRARRRHCRLTRVPGTETKVHRLHGSDSEKKWMNRRASRPAGMRRTRMGTGAGLIPRCETR